MSPRCLLRAAKRGLSLPVSSSPDLASAGLSIRHRPALLGRFGERRMMFGGGVSLALALLGIGAGLPWQGEFLAFVVLGLASTPCTV